MRVYAITNQLKGDWMIYKPDWRKFVSILVGIFSSWRSHVSLAWNAHEEVDASVEADGVTRNDIDWKRRPYIIPLPFDAVAFRETMKEFKFQDYGKEQVGSIALIMLTGNEELLNESGVHCSEFLIVYGTKHPLFAKAVGQNRISKRLQRIACERPSRATPKHCEKVGKAMMKAHNPKAKMVKHYVVAR